MILATIKQINQKQLILVQGEDSKKGQLIYLTRKGNFQVILLQNDQISIRETKETHETGQNSKNKHFEVKSSTDWSFLWTLIDSCHPMTFFFCLKTAIKMSRIYSPFQIVFANIPGYIVKFYFV